MRKILLAVAPLLIAFFFAMAGNSLQSTLIVLRAKIEGFSTVTTGLMLSCYFAGFLLSSILTPRIVGRVGHIRVFAALAALVAIAVLAFPLAIDPLAWSALRVVVGFAYSGLYVVTESWLNDRAGNARRGEVLGVYMIVQSCALVLGQLMLNLAPPETMELFMMAAMLIAAAVLPVMLARAPTPHFESAKPLSPLALYRLSPLATVIVCGGGVTIGAFYNMSPLYAGEIGLDVRDISILMALALAGSGFISWPLGKLSDIGDRRQVIAFVNFGAAALAFAIMLAAGQQATYAIYALFFLYGGLPITLYTLAIAHANDRLEPSQMVAGSGGLIIAYGIGALAGPSLGGIAMDYFGRDGLIYLLIVAHMALGIYAVWRKLATRKPTAPRDEPKL